MPRSDRTSSDRPVSDSTGSDSLPEADPSATKGKRSRRHEGPQPLTVFTGSHGLQGDKPRAGEDADPDDTSTPAGDPDARPDLRR